MEESTCVYRVDTGLSLVARQTGPPDGNRSVGSMIQGNIYMGYKCGNILVSVCFPCDENCSSGLIVVGVAVSEGRAITAEDFGYLLALFVALYIIRGIVVITAYPILRSVSLLLLCFRLNSSTLTVRRAYVQTRPLYTGIIWPKAALLCFSPLKYCRYMTPVYAHVRQTFRTYKHNSLSIVVHDLRLQGSAEDHLNLCQPFPQTIPSTSPC